jgi:anti-anti-sigma factor
MTSTQSFDLPETVMHVSHGAEPPYLIVRLRGELDMSNAEDLQDPFHLDRSDLTTVLLDMGQLTFCDGAGLRALLKFREAHIKRGRRFSATHVHPRVRRIMDICGLSEAFVA